MGSTYDNQIAEIDQEIKILQARKAGLAEEKQFFETLVSAVINGGEE